MAHKLDVLREHCAVEGRDYDAITKTILYVRPVLADVDAFVSDLDRYAGLGITEAEVMPDRHPVEFAEQLAERIVPRLNR